MAKVEEAVNPVPNRQLPEHQLHPGAPASISADPRCPACQLRTGEDRAAIHSRFRRKAAPTVGVVADRHDVPRKVAPSADRAEQRPDY